MRCSEIIINDWTIVYTVAGSTSWKWSVALSHLQRLRRRWQKQQQHNITIKLSFCRSHISMEHRTGTRSGTVDQLIGANTCISCYVLCVGFARAREWTHAHTTFMYSRRAHSHSVLYTHTAVAASAFAENRICTTHCWHIDVCYSVAHICFRCCRTSLVRWWMDDWMDGWRERERTG